MQKGFTLIELIVVIAIIAVLTLIVIGNVHQYQCEKSGGSDCEYHKTESKNSDSILK